jgi:ATP-dependent Lon protease
MLPLSYWLSDLENKSDRDSSGEIIDISDTLFDSETLPELLPILPLRNTVLFPGVVIPITVSRDKSIQLVKEANSRNAKLLGVVAQRSMEMEDPSSSDLFEIGTIALILRLLRMPDGSVTIIIQGRERFRIEQMMQETPYFQAKIRRLEETHVPEDSAKAMMLTLKQEAQRIIEISPNLPSEAKLTLQNLNDLGLLTHFIASNLSLEVQDKQELLEQNNPLLRAEKVLEYLSKELHVLELSEEIQSRVRGDLDKQQRDYILRQQIKAIQDELGEQNIEQEIETLKKQAETKLWTAAAQEAFDKEIQKLYRLNPASPEYGVSYNYIQWLLDLPWKEFTTDRFNLPIARKVLNTDHFGLDKVKERIIEYLAVLQLKKNLKAPILCFYGPPGVGKTSLGRSIAQAMNRQFVRISLGGVRDEAEIRGHRRTYIGSMPGRILQGLRKAKAGNPVFVLDEIDKVGNDFRGDPSSALLEVLDPEQNFAFNDHYLEIDYDLSTILFIATANSLDTIQPALRDRMELIEVNGYTIDEKLAIARRHLIPRNRIEHGLKARQLQIEPEAINRTIENYTRESGVRMLNQQIAGLCRGVAKQIIKNPNACITITAADIPKLLGIPRFEKEVFQAVHRPGVAIGLAWTPVGGEILFIETVISRGSGKLTLTGQLGEVMKESATVAFMFLKAHARLYGIAPVVFERWDVHIHIPAGATPKDGPSAGVTMLTALCSIYSQRMVRLPLAMTGEITLRGKVLPVGGIQEKVLAAARAGITTLILPKVNEKDVQEIKSAHRELLTIHYVEEMHQVLTLALEPDPISDPIDFTATVDTAAPNNATTDTVVRVI